VCRPVPQKEKSHWWQMKFRPAESNDNVVPNQVAVPVPVPVHQKVIIKSSIIYIYIFFII